MCSLPVTDASPLPLTCQEFFAGCKKLFSGRQVCGRGVGGQGRRSSGRRLFSIPSIFLPFRAFRQAGRSPYRDGRAEDHLDSRPNQFSSPTARAVE